MVTDDELVNRVALHDQEAFLTLYDRYANRVFALALRMARDSHTAEEITQDVFLKLWNHARSYLAARGTLAAWLLTITRNATLDRLRLENRRPPSSCATDPEEIWDLLIDEKFSTDEMRWRSLYFAIQALPDRQRLVIELGYYHGMSHIQIADHLGWPVGTVKTRMRMGMDQLRQQWLEGSSVDQPEEQKSKPSKTDV